MFFKYIITICLLITFSYTSNIKVYASKQLKINTLTKPQLSMLYLKKTNTINKQKIIIYDNTQDHEEFVKVILNKTPYQIHAYWMKQIFLGKKLAPEKLTSKELNKKLLTTPNAIVYSRENLEGKVVYEIQ